MARSSNRHISCIVSVGTNSGSQTFGCCEKENFVIVQNEKIFQEVLFQTQGLAPPYLVLLMQQCCLKKLPSTCTSCQQLPIVHSSPPLFPLIATSYLGSRLHAELFGQTAEICTTSGSRGREEGFIQPLSKIFLQLRKILPSHSDSDQNPLSTTYMTRFKNEVRSSCCFLP